MKMKQYWNRKTVGLLASALLVGAGAQAQIIDSNVQAVALFATDPIALAGTSSGAFTVIRYGETNDALTVNLDIAGTASNGVDYALISNAVTIPAGLLAVDIPINPIASSTNHGNQTVVLTLETNAAYRAFSRGAVVEIIDDTFNIPQPTVTLISPTNGSVYGFPATIPLQASASDPDVQITSVSFYANDQFLGRSTNSPFSLTWTNAGPGRYAIFARAVDQAEQSIVSAPAHITVTNSSGGIISSNITFPFPPIPPMPQNGLKTN